jgi:hypothetical protein
MGKTRVDIEMLERRRVIEIHEKFVNRRKMKIEHEVVYMEIRN